ncbi:TonB-denpendent receptor [Novosphingobium lindaniclasticum LE124]|uniref:TonB-denpendent receptor n=2 Tax=Novosphingobium TaxID=165696 RepID=T0HKP0_9SPHN|nr:TonB-denpendent receptor [Novosphingobium lindaniclasticum LE124]
MSAASMTIVAAPAFAQEVAATPPSKQDLEIGIGDIVVTAQKRSENVQNVPIAISAVSSAYLESRGVDSIDKLGTIAPNMKIERAPGSKTVSQISIRGSVTINPAITWEPAVGLYMDGVYIAKAQGSIFDIADLERVEVLRGPQGTLYGRNALAGAVNLITRKPSGELGGTAEFTYGSFDEVKFRGVLDLPKLGIFSVKLSGQYRSRGGLIDIVPNPVPNVPAAQAPKVDEADTINSGSFMVQVRAELAENITADYTFDYSRSKQQPQLSQLLQVNENGDPRDIFDPNSPGYASGGAYFPLNLYTDPKRVTTASIDADVYEKTRSYGHALTLTGDFGGATVKSTTAYRNLKYSDGLDLDGSPLPVAYTQRITDYHAFSQELQVTGKAISDKLSYAAGAFYFTEKAETANPQSYFGGATDLDSEYGSHTKALALYTQLDYEFLQGLKLTLGARYTHERKDIRRFFRINYDAASGITSPLVVADIGYGDVPDAKYNSFTPAVTLGYELTDQVNVYARYAKGFKSGGFNGETNVFVAPTADCPSGATELCNPYKPETVDSYELGIKTKTFGNRLIFNVSAFRDEHKNMQLAIFTAGTGAASIVRNAGAARIQGLEFETVFHPFDALTLNGSLALLDPKYKRFMDLVNGVETNVADNRAFPHAPKVTASGGADLKVAQGDWGKLNLYADVSYVAKYYTYPYALATAAPSDQNAHTSQSKGRTIVNLRASLTQLPLLGAETELSLFVRNLTREASPTNFIDFGPSFGGMVAGYFPEPRTFGVTVGVKF